MSGTQAPQNDEAVLARMRDDAQRDVLEAERTLKDAQEAHMRAIEKLAHVQALLRLTAPAALGAPLSTRPDAAASSSAASTPDGVRGNGQVADGLAVDAAVAVLEEAKQPLHYREIYAAIERRGVLIRSSNPPNTLLTRMLRDGRFRPADQRGYYELARGEAHHHFRPSRGSPSKVAQ